MAEDYLWSLVELAARITELEQLEGQLEKADWETAKEEFETLEVRFRTLRDEYVDALLGPEDSRESAVDEVTAQLAAFRERADPSWLPALTYTSDNLIPRLSREASRSPGFRRALKRAPWFAGGIAVLAYFAIRLFSATPATASIETPTGLQQRAAAVEKVLRYDDWMDTKVRRGGWLKGILLWPIEPTEAEIESAAEFVGLVLEGQQYAEGCGSVQGYGDTLTDEQINMVSDVVDYVQRDDTSWQEPAVMTLVVGLTQAGKC